MKTFLSGICASVLAASFTFSGASPIAAAPMLLPAGQAADVARHGANPDVQFVRDNWRHGGRGDWAGRGPWGGRDMSYYNRGRGGYYNGWRGRHYNGWGGRSAYYNGYRGYRYYRPGYRYYNDYWFPGAAFVAGALIGGAIANSGPSYSYRGGNAHEQWCYSRYRSYRASDNTFQPYNGPRRQCYSPY